MKLTSYCIAMAAVALGLTACDSHPKIAGSWTASAPTSIAAEIPAASTADALLSIDFVNNSSSDGTFLLSSLVNATQPVRADSLPTLDSPYEVSVSATASVKGSWTYDSKEHDDLLMQFDLSSLQVDIDPNGVTFSQNLLTGAQQPAVDSLTSATAEIWKRQIGNAFRAALSRYSKLEDVEVTNNGTALKFEVKDITGSDRDVVLHKVIMAD